MTEKKQPEALRRASLLKLSGVLQGSVAMEVADDAIRLHAELETLRAGYAAARLEIESLQARIKTMTEVRVYELAMAHLDGRMRAAQPAGAQQPGDCGNTPYDEGPFTLAQQPGDERAAFEARFPVPGGVSWNGSEYVVEDDYINSYRCDRFVGQWAAWQARASHGQAPAAPPECKTEAERTAFAFGWFKALEQQRGQAPAQAAPAAVAGCTRSHPHENMDSACRAKAAIAEMQNMAARGAEATASDLERFVAMLAAAPAQPAPKQEPGKAVHQFRKQHCADWYDGRADHSDGRGPYEERTLYTSPQQEAQEPVYAFRRKGLDDFCTCTEKRYAELSAKPNLFETRIFYTAPQPQAGAVGKAVHQFRKKHCADWYDGLADHSDGGGPYEERTLYTAGAVPLTPDEALDAFCQTPGIHQFVQAFMAGVRFAEQRHGIKGGQHGAE